VVLHRMWVDGSEFAWSKKDSTRFLRLPEAAAEKEENRHQGDNAFCFGRKNVLTGRRVG